MKRRITLTISAMILATQLGSPVEADEPSLEQLYTIAAILEANDVAALRNFIESNPDILDGDGQLTLLLRRFMVASRDLNAYISSGGGMAEVLAGFALIAGEGTIEEGSDPGDPEPEPAPEPTPAPAPEPDPEPTPTPTPDPGDTDDDDDIY